MRVTEAQNYAEKRNSIAYEYIEYFEELGFTIILVPNNSKNIKKYFNFKIDLVLLSGGNNVNPLEYGNSEVLDDVYNERDTTEFELLKIAKEKNIKVVGICRGFHLINVYLNGSLKHKIKKHVNINHKLKSDIEFLDKKSTNSFHNQAILKKNLSKKLDSIASVDSEIVEAFLSKDKNILGIQWHPERQNKKFDKKLINKFLKGKI
jgi:putative glutamine amidotransferase